MDKVYPSTEAAIEDIFDGAVIAFGSFFTAGKPTALAKESISGLVYSKTVLHWGVWHPAANVTESGHPSIGVS